MTGTSWLTSLGRLDQGDCLSLLPGVGSGTVDMVFADPPFNLSKDYGPGVTDSMTEEGYLEWCRSWITECARTLAPGGALYLYNIPKWNVALAPMLTEAGLDFRHWIAVDMKNSLPIAGRLYPSHYSLLYYTKGKPKSFTRLRTPIAECRHCSGEIKDYGGHRNKMHPEGVTLTDVWTDLSPVRHRGTKNRGANELPETLVQRAIETSTAPGDLVLDPFGGSGTTFAVAERLGRRWRGMELGTIEPIVTRMEGVTAA